MSVAIEENGPPRLPLVSIAMPVRNVASTVAIAIRSILLQTYTNWELLLIDDGSSDHTAEIVREFRDERIRLIAHVQSLGLAVRLNEAIALAKGRYFARMDGDDVCFPSRLTKQVAYLEARQEVDLLGCGAIVFNRSGRLQGALPQRLTHEDICAKPWAGFYLPHPTWMGRVEWFRANPYDNSAIRAQDQELLLRTYRHSRFASLPDICLGYRQDSVPLARAVRSRLHFGRALLAQIVGGRNLALMPGVFLLMGKLLLDVLSIPLGVRSRHHRAESVGPDLVQTWDSLWASLHVTNDVRLTMGGQSMERN